MMSRNGEPERYFGCEVVKNVLEFWSGSKQPISFGEALAVVIAKMLWKDVLRQRHCFIAVDNVAAQQADQTEHLL
eukprot:4681909-Amphidinium_carterae.1